MRHFYRLLCSDQTYQDNDYTTLNPVISAQPKALPKSRGKTMVKEAPRLALVDGNINDLALHPGRPETANTELEIALEMYADTMENLVNAAAGNHKDGESSFAKDSDSMDFREFEYAAKVLHEQWTAEQEELTEEMSTRQKNATHQAVDMEASIKPLTAPGNSGRAPPAGSGQEQRSQADDAIGQPELRVAVTPAALELQDSRHFGFTQDLQPRTNGIQSTQYAAGRTLFLADDPDEDGIEYSLDV